MHLSVWQQAPARPWSATSLVQEDQKVVKSLAQHGFPIPAIPNHMVMEEEHKTCARLYLAEAQCRAGEVDEAIATLVEAQR